MILNSMFGVEQTGRSYHIDDASYQTLQASQEYQALIFANPDALKFSGNKDNIIVIVDVNEF